MNRGTQVALAVGAGYLLGRRRKMRMALMLSGAAMTGGLGGVPGQVLKRGTKLIGSADVLSKLSPELGEVTGLIGGDLLPAGKAAARAAVSSRINALSDRVHERAEALRSYENGEAGEGEAGEDEVRAERAGEEEAGEDEETRPRSRRREPDEEPEEEPEEPEEPAVRRPARTARAGARSRRSSGESRASDEDDVDQPVRAAGRSARSTAGRAAAPVRRARR